MFVFVLRLLLPRHADGQRVQCAGVHRAATFSAAARWTSAMHPLRQVRHELPDGRDRRRYASRRIHASAGAVHRLWAVCAGVRPAAGPGDGAGPRLPAALPQLVLADRPCPARNADDELEGQAAAAFGRSHLPGGTSCRENVSPAGKRPAIGRPPAGGIRMALCTGCYTEYPSRLSHISPQACLAPLWRTPHADHNPDKNVCRRRPYAGRRDAFPGLRAGGDFLPPRARPPSSSRPKPAAAPRINGARVFGVRPGNPFLVHDSRHRRAADAVRRRSDCPRG